MRITFQFTQLDGTTGTMLICTGGEDSPFDFVMEGTGLVQSAQYPRAEEIDLFGRGNKQTNVAFSLAKSFTSLLSAETYVTDAHSLNGLKGSLKLELANQFGGLGATRNINNCACVSVRARHTGQTAFASFNFIGGKVSVPT